MHMLSHTHPLLEQRHCSGISDLVKESYTTLQGISRNPDIAVDLHKQLPRQRPACRVRYGTHRYMTCNYTPDPTSQPYLHTNRVKTGEDTTTLLLTVRVKSPPDGKMSPILRMRHRNHVEEDTPPQSAGYDRSAVQ